jgi:hypothetical protein
MLKKTSFFSLALVSAMALMPALTSSAALAVDDDTSIDSVDLTSVRDKIKAAN